jgi:hypothetical protein
MEYFASLPGGGLIGSVTLSDIVGVIRTTSGNFPDLGTLRGDPYSPSNPDFANIANMINRFALGGNLASVARGDYLYVESHGFIVVGWGPFLGTIDGIDYAYNNTLGATRSDANPIPYIADFCFGTDGSSNDGTGWLQDPRPRPFYTAATQVLQNWLRPDQIPYLRKRPVENFSTVPISVFDNFTAVDDVWQFYKIPDSIALTTLPINRLYFSG